MKKSVAYMGWLGHNNIGDEACFLGISQCLPGVQLDYWDIGPWPKLQLPDLSIIGGGTLLDLSFDTRGKHILALQEAGVPTVFWGTGVLPCSGLMSPQAKKMLEGAALVGVRGPQSLRLLQANGIMTAKIIGDPALVLPRSKLPIGKSSRVVAVNVGDARGRMLGSEQYVVDQLNLVTRNLVASGYTVILFSMWPSDEKYISKICYATKVRQFTASVPELLEFFRTCYCVIGMKLHAVVLSATAGVPFISIGYRDKCLDFAESVGLERWVVPANDPKLAQKIQALFTMLPKYYEVVTERLSSYIDGYKVEHKKTAVFVSHLLGST
jgi:polysaccharide pyruvyl transferase WcaK-like protein